jgi:hypothetical protein
MSIKLPYVTCLPTHSLIHSSICSSIHALTYLATQSRADAHIHVFSSLIHSVSQSLTQYLVHSVYIRTWRRTWTRRYQYSSLDKGTWDHWQLNQTFRPRDMWWKGFVEKDLFHLEVIRIAQKTLYIMLMPRPGMLRCVAWQIERVIGRRKQMLQLSELNIVTKDRNRMEQERESPNILMILKLNFKFHS